MKSLLNEVIGEGHGYCANQGYSRHSISSFNDLGFYMNRCAKAHPFSHEELCKKAEISSIDVYHSNEYCNGIYVEYKSTFSNGFTERTMPPSHRYNSGYYARSDQRSTITLQEGEYLAEIRTRQERLLIKLHSLQINVRYRLGVMVVVVKICLFRQI